MAAAEPATPRSFQQVGQGIVLSVPEVASAEAREVIAAVGMKRSGSAEVGSAVGAALAQCVAAVLRFDGMAAIALSALVVSLMGAGVRFMGGVFPATQDMFVRSLIQGSLSFSYLAYRGEAIFGQSGVRRFVLLRGVIGAMYCWIFFFAVTKIPLGDAMTILSLGPVFTAIYSFALLGQPFAGTELAALVFSMVGVTLVSRPSFIFRAADAEAHTLHGAGVAGASEGAALRQATMALCVLGAALWGSVCIIVRHIGRAAHCMSCVFSFSCFCGLLSSVALIVGVEEANWPSIGEVGVGPYAMLAAIGLMACVSQGLVNFGMQREQPAVASITRQLDVPLCFVWQVALFKEPPVLLSVFGSGLMLSGTTVIFGQRLLDSKADTASPAAAAQPASRAGGAEEP